MIRNYFKTAWRNLVNSKVYSAINIGGLALGMACSLLIGRWVNDEWSYDRFLPDADNLYFVRFNSTFNGEMFTNWATPGPLQEAIAKDVPEVAAVAKITSNRETLLKVGQVAVKEYGRYATDDFFGVFDLPVLAGNPKAALRQPNQVVITRQVAEKLFPPGQALGKTLQLNNDKFYTVGAVVENIPSNATVRFDWLVNFSEQEEDWMKTWGNNSFLTYARLGPQVTAARAEASMKGIYARYTDAKDVKNTYPVLHPLTDVHLYSDYKNGKVVGGQIEYVRIFSLVAVFILLIACINFMNLATARSQKRAREIGVRKVVGAHRWSLISQFISESMLTCLLAAGVALVLVSLALPAFNQLFDKHLVLELASPSLWLGTLGLVLLTGFVAGSYPALFLSGLKPVRILKGTLRLGAGPARFRRVLVVVQFSLSIFLIVAMLAVDRQMQYLRTKNLGLDRENVVYLRLEGEVSIPRKMETFRQEVLRIPAIAAATTATDLPINITSNSADLTWPGKDPNLQTNVYCLFAGNDFTRTLNIKLVDGRDFRAGSPADTSNYLINEATARLMGMKDPVGQEVEFLMGKGRVIGLMKDFHLTSLHEAIKPLIICFTPQNSNYLLVKTRPGQATQAIAGLERLTKRFNPNYPFSYHFVDEAYEQLYRTEQQVHTLVNSFGMLAIVISCLGLFGLAAFTAEQRTKEIGIRKVLGASVASLVGLLSKEFLRLVLVALLLATPLAWWAVREWLSSFQYHASLSWWLFTAAGALALLIAFLTISFQSIKAALANPVKSLRSE
ncbi:MAG: Acidobacterial duplicated orphan permease (function unknown) [uncultured Cytophagales bacterium]|uniref:ABC transporter, permease protein n=1 Tax=uncultured Cytophagales bacterium TaxID=158755 RepID=A0A6J4JUK1_9SPHI|nr:MAG: Acidobacterial duplicated orphan permease (function unknown) [uncultured Cytophagales bacterium]